MLTGLDHLVIDVDDLAEAVEKYRTLGFTVTTGGDTADTTAGTARATFGDFYVEFHSAPDGRREVGDGNGRFGLVFRSHDIETEVDRLRSNGIEVSDRIAEVASLQARRMTAVDWIVPVGLLQGDHQPSDQATAHPNTATVVERVYIAVESIDRDLRIFEDLLGMTAPEPEMGTVIMSMMSVFYVGDIGIAVAEPRGPGPTASALEANGPGLFQILFRAQHLDLAARTMVANGAPAPARGTRLSGESALLVEPAMACGLYLAFAGPP